MRFIGKENYIYGIISLLTITIIISIIYYKSYNSKNLKLRCNIIKNNEFSKVEFGDFVEKDFPYITSVLDARNIGDEFPDFNVVSRGLSIQLGNDSYACFDMDLLRWSVAWTGEFISMVLPAQGSYNNFFKRNNNELPIILGTPRVANGMYAGWSVHRPNFQDIRPKSQQVEGIYWGPVSEEFGRWNGTYVHGKSVLLSYSIQGIDILELPGSKVINDEVIFMRTFRVGSSTKKLILNVAQVNYAVAGSFDTNSGHLIHGIKQDSVTATVFNGENGQVKIVDDQYITIEINPSDEIREFTVSIWKGETSELEKIIVEAASVKVEIPDCKNAPSHWKERVFTKGQTSPDTNAFVTDVLTLPIPNPWGRNVRVADVAFFSNNRAAVSTYEGDIWLVDGIDESLDRMKWKRFASGLYEPMAIEIFRDQIYTFGREGIIRFHDLNGDDEADFYENFCNIPNQSTGTREWPADMIVDDDGNFYVAKGGHLTGYEGILPYFSNSIDNTRWKSSSIHSGSILKIDSTGRNVQVLATGFRMPYLGINKKTGLLSASDQEGNYVPSSPIYLVEKGDYFGVPVTAHKSKSNTLEKSDSLEIKKALTWIPHYVDRSSASQAWINSNQMGPLDNEMVHFSYGRPGIFRVLFDTVGNSFNGGVVSIDANYPAPVMKGETSSLDGQLYFAGFNNYVSNSEGISALMRLRYTGQPSYYVNGFEAGIKGVTIRFDFPVSASSVKSVNNYEVKRWNYKRTQSYGSGYFKLDGIPGHEVLTVAAAYLSEDESSIFLYIPDMQESDQLEINYDLRAGDGELVKGSLWLTIHKLKNLDLEDMGFPSIDFSEIVSSNGQKISKEIEISVDRGQELFNKLGCMGCHSIQMETEGMYGPPFQGMYGKERKLNDGSFIMVDDDYIRESIINPGAKVANGYIPEMPSFEGILSDRDIASIILYLKSL